MPPLAQTPCKVALEVGAEKTAAMSDNFLQGTMAARAALRSFVRKSH